MIINTFSKIADFKLHIFAGVLIVFIIFVVTTFFISKNRDKDYTEALESQSNSIRTLIIDYRLKNVTFFNLSSMKNVRREALNTFLNQYPENERKKVVHWIDALANGDSTISDVLETIVLVSKEAKPYHTLLKVEKVDLDKKILHISSYLLKKGEDLTSFEETEKKVVTRAFVAETISKVHKKNGFTLCFKFNYLDSSESGRDIDPVIFGHIKSIFLDFLQGGRYFYDVDENVVCLTDINCKAFFSTAQVIASSLENEIGKYLSLNGLQDQISFWVGGVEHLKLKNKGEIIIREAINCADYAFLEKKNSGILWFIPGRKTKVTDNDIAYRTEVERIISSRKAKTKFRLIYNSEKKNYLGYLCKTFVDDPFFQDIEELQDYAYKAGDIKELLASLVNDAVPRFINQKPSENVSLFIPIRFDFRNILIPLLNNVPNVSKARVTIEFWEDDIYKKLQSSKEENMVNDLRLLKSRGFAIALVLNDTELTLTNKLYGLFDSFVVNFSSSLKGPTSDNAIRASLHVLVEKLIKYQKPIICNDLQGWDAVELLVRSGLTYLCSDSLSPFNDMVLRIDPKVIKKIDGMKG